MCTQEDTHAHLFTRTVLDDVMSQNELTTLWTPNVVNFDQLLGAAFTWKLVQNTSLAVFKLFKIILDVFGDFLSENKI